MKGFGMAQPNIKHTVQVLVLNHPHGSELALPRTVILAGPVTAFRETQTQRMTLHWRGGRSHCPWWKSSSENRLRLGPRFERANPREL